MSGPPPLFAHRTRLRYAGTDDLTFWHGSKTMTLRAGDEVIVHSHGFHMDRSERLVRCRSVDPRLSAFEVAIYEKDVGNWTVVDGATAAS